MLANHIAMLHKQRKQDGIIFIGSYIEHRWLDYLLLRVMNIFRTDCPIFMHLELSNVMQLKLDSNIIFYERKDFSYIMFDKFSVNGGSPIIFEIGSWVEGNGLKLQKSINRWERRKDLMGATFVNTLQETGIRAHFIYNETGAIIGSDGWFQEILFYVINTLNLTVETKLDMSLEGECLGWLQEGLTDVCSGREVEPKIHDAWDASFPLTIHRQAHTLLAGVNKKGTAPDAWVYVTVFGTPQWLLYFSILLLISISLPLIHVVSKRGQPDARGFPIYEGIVMISFFLIQRNYPGLVHAASKRILALTTAILTMLVYIYYSNDITSKMTAGPAPVPIKTFQDVLDRGYQVITVGTYHMRLLRDDCENVEDYENQIGTPKCSVYLREFYKERERVTFCQMALSVDIPFCSMWTVYTKKTTSECEQFIDECRKWKIPWWWEWNQKNIDHSGEIIMNDPMTLFYCTSSCLADKITNGEVMALKMDDTYYSRRGFALRGDSEYLPLFNHHLLKAFETGILHRHKVLWQEKPPIKIGLTEPKPLGFNNVMFPFILLGVIMTLSVIASVLEKVIKKISVRIAKSKWPIFIRRNNKGPADAGGLHGGPHQGILIRRR